MTASAGTGGTRIDDGRCDRSGNFVFSTMDEGYPLKVVGKFHRLINMATLTIETPPQPEVAIPNSVWFRPDGGTMYYCDVFRLPHPIPPVQTDPVAITKKPAFLWFAGFFVPNTWHYSLRRLQQRRCDRRCQHAAMALLWPCVIIHP
nr:SMP-30/gluconolactonase/LRE family protein [Serratia odorifera]